MSKNPNKKIALDLREAGLTLGEICEKTGEKKSTVFYWISGGREHRKASEKVSRRITQKRVRAMSYIAGSRTREFSSARELARLGGAEIAKRNEKLHLMGCMLYWAEGSKSKHSVVFCNSDPDMMRVFIRFLRAYFDIDESRLTFKLNCYLSDGETEEEKKLFWMKVISASESQYRKSLMKGGGEKSDKPTKNGICYLTYNDVLVISHIYGAIQEYAGFVSDNPVWNR